MNKEEISRVLSKILDHTPEVKLRAGKQYAHGRTEPGGLISVAALKDRIRVSFITEGKANDVSTGRFLSWVNESGIMGAKAVGDVGFLLREGSINTDKREICAEIPYDMRSEEDIITDTVSAYNALLEKLSGSFEPKSMNSSRPMEQSEDKSEVPKVVTLDFRYSNGDTGEDFEEAGYEIKVTSEVLQKSLVNWLNLRDEESLARFAIALIGNPSYNECAEYGAAFEELKEVFFWRGVNKLGWGDVMVEISDIAIDGETIDLTEMERATFDEDCKVQLVNTADPDMYMIDCVL